MKTLLIAWVTAMLLYLITPVVSAQETNPADFMNIWSDFSNGSACITIQDSVDHSDARAELWLVNNYEVEWIKDVVGYSCIELDLDEESNLHVITYDPGVVISVVKATNSELMKASAQF
ncbi:MAG: hypothetical protein OEX07_04385 [Gammaproteobacteria bacterium]|nr:hypothetical protein [Gammaproteobacteria bacterium]